MRIQWRDKKNRTHSSCRLKKKKKQNVPHKYFSLQIPCVTLLTLWHIASKSNKYKRINCNALRMVFEPDYLLLYIRKSCYESIVYQIHLNCERLSLRVIHNNGATLRCKRFNAGPHNGLFCLSVSFLLSPHLPNGKQIRLRSEYTMTFYHSSTRFRTDYISQSEFFFGKQRTEKHGTHEKIKMRSLQTLVVYDSTIMDPDTFKLIRKLCVEFQLQPDIEFTCYEAYMEYFKRFFSDLETKFKQTTLESNGSIKQTSQLIDQVLDGVENTSLLHILALISICAKYVNGFRCEQRLFKNLAKYLQLNGTPYSSRELRNTEYVVFKLLGFSVSKTVEQVMKYHSDVISFFILYFFLWKCRLNHRNCIRRL